MKYMTFIKHTEDYRNKKPPQALMEAMGEFVGEAMKSGKMLDGAGLKPTSDGTRVLLKGGKMTVVDGPFTETKEIVGGFAIFELASKREAIDIAKKFMDLHKQHWPEFDGECELRPFEDM